MKLKLIVFIFTLILVSTDLLTIVKAQSVECVFTSPDSSGSGTWYGQATYFRAFYSSLYVRQFKTMPPTLTYQAETNEDPAHPCPVGGWGYVYSPYTISAERSVYTLSVSTDAKLAVRYPPCYFDWPFCVKPGGSIVVAVGPDGVTTVEWYS